MHGRLTLDDFFIACTLFNVFLSASLAIAQLFSKQRTLRGTFMFTLFATLALLQGATYLVFSGRDLAYPELFRVSTPLLCLIGPALYLWYAATFEENFNLKRKHLWHAVPAVVTMVGLLPSYLQSPAAKLVQMKALKLRRLMWHDLFEGVAFLLLCSYLIVVFIRLRPLWNWSSVKHNTNARYFSFVAGCALVMIVMHVGGFASGQLILRQSAALLVSLILLTSFLVSHRHPEYFQGLQATYKKEKYLRSVISPEDDRQLQTSLRAAMQSESLYRDPDLTLASLAKYLGFTPHQVSEYLNSREDQNFAAYVNAYRIERARELLRQQPDGNILSIAYEVGFNSKTSFQRAFKQVTGQTATQYRTRG